MLRDTNSSGARALEVAAPLPTRPVPKQEQPSVAAATSNARAKATRVNADGLCIRCKSPAVTKWHCAEHAREVSRKTCERIAKTRAEFFSGKSCVFCGSTDRLEIDHIDPSTKVSHKIFGWTKERREGELAKCRVLCFVCHNARHSQEMRERLGNGSLHGNEGGYITRNCRCDECVAWARETWRKKRCRERARRIEATRP